MKERGIIFSGPMVYAIQEDRKTQTRRIVKPQPDGETVMHVNYGHGWSEALRCPYGVAGDRLWVRETFALESKSYAGDKVRYRADGKPTSGAWRPSIHMPRWASRITLEITGVRVERLQEISEADAKAEGVIPTGRRATHKWCNGEDVSHRRQFADLWDSLHGKGAWEQNPWVWVVEFRRLP